MISGNNKENYMIAIGAAPQQLQEVIKIDPRSERWVHKFGNIRDIGQKIGY